jgi:predicted ATPase
VVKIALVGTHGVGKTTLCFDIAARLKRLDLGVDLVKEVARDCPLPINRDTTLDAQTWILHTQCAREIAAARSGDVVVCDRSVLDNYAYLVHSMGRRKELDPWIRAWCAGYDGMYLVPLWQRPTFDGTRDTDPDFQRSIHETLVSLVEDFGLNVVRLQPDRPDCWVGQILKDLSIPSDAPQTRLFSEE